MKTLLDLLDEIGGMPEKRSFGKKSTPSERQATWSYNACLSDFRDWLGGISKEDLLRLPESVDDEQDIKDIAYSYFMEQGFDKEASGIMAYGLVDKLSKMKRTVKKEQGN